MNTAALPSSLHIRPMLAHELDMGIAWAAQEGWNPGLHDRDSFFAADPEGFLMAEWGGEPVGMISAVRYGSSFGFIGFYIVRPVFRGQGHGLALWRAGMARLAGRLVGLDGVVAQQANYRKSGFVLAYNNVRMQGATHVKGAVHPDVVALEMVDFDQLLRYDAPLFPAGREVFLRQWVRQTGSTALGMLSGGRLKGYGVVRPCQVGYKVGPLLADDAQVAHDLLNALMHHLPLGEQVQLDMAADHTASRELAHAWQMSPVFETARMYTGAAPALDLPRQFGITSFELG